MVAALHEDVGVDQPNPVLNLLDEVVLLELLHDFRDSSRAYAHVLGDFRIGADERVVARVRVLGDVHENVQLAAVDDSEDGQEVHEVALPEVLGAVSAFCYLVYQHYLPGLHVHDLPLTLTHKRLGVRVVLQ